LAERLPMIVVMTALAADAGDRGDACPSLYTLITDLHCIIHFEEYRGLM
jgi:hypothetical protein